MAPPTMAKYLEEVRKQQILDTEKARLDCVGTHGVAAVLNTTKAVFDENIQKWRCPAFWDNLSCWPDTPENSVVTISCPSYIAGFNKLSNATRRCMPNGTWFIHDEYKTYWANYSQCFESTSSLVLVDVPVQNTTKLIDSYFPIVKMISRTGYAVSFCTLIVALLIMLSIKKLHCQRNKLHMHLFISFILRAFISFVKDFTFVSGIGLTSDFTCRNGSYYLTLDTESNWECKLLTSLWEYFITANYFWILMEGLYLHNLIFRALYAESTRNLICYVLLGWGLPVLVIVPWVVMRLMKEDTLCWTTHDNYVTFAVIKIPTMISILINLVLFIKISVVLFTKIQNSVNYERAKRYQKWAKSTLVLAPLFGIHYALLITMSFPAKHNEVVEVVWLFCDQMFASFQGFFVAILYCFMNGEIKTELKVTFESCVMNWASESICRFCFPCRERYIRAATGRASVCTTLSCSSLYNNGVRPNSRNRWEVHPKMNNTLEPGVHGFSSLHKSIESCCKFGSIDVHQEEPRIYLQRNCSEPEIIEEKLIMLQRQ